MIKNANQEHKKGLTLAQKIALKLTTFLGTMICFMVFCIIALISFPQALASHNALIIISWLAQTFIQLVALSVLQMSNNIQSKHQETIAELDYESDLRAEEDIHHLMAEFDEVKKELKIIKQLIKVKYAARRND